MSSPRIEVPSDAIASFCRKHNITRLALFGSVLRDDFRPDSDVDVLVEFAPETRVGLIGLSSLENELSQILHRKVDLNTLGFLSRYYRDQVIAEAETQYDAA